LPAHVGYFDAVFLSRPSVASEYLPALEEFPSCRLLFYGHDLHHERLTRQYEISQDPSLLPEIEQAKAEEIAVWSRVHVSFYLSDEEVARVRALVPGADARRMCAPIFDESSLHATAPDGRFGLLFVAGFAHAPNTDAACWLVREIMPLVWRERPDLQLTLAGSSPTEEVKSLAGPLVTVTGWIDDQRLEELYGQARVAVVPLRFGAGVKIKVLDSMKNGVPLVTTPVGAQGLAGLEDICPIRPDPEAIAREILALVADDERWRTQSAAQMAFIRTYFSGDTLRRQLTDAVEEASCSNRNES
jgi:glycosyltransferase involved in cell wall biosynthesis